MSAEQSRGKRLLEESIWHYLVVLVAFFFVLWLIFEGAPW